ncbi:MAG: EamA family transporter [Candidatus Eisenbacteria bacterium]|nr:EamA family transporter [Candidatus Eisenbacteria bacterium]
MIGSLMTSAPTDKVRGAAENLSRLRRPTIVTESHLGEFYSVLAALIWAGSVVLFRLSGRTFRPLALNFFKNTVAVVIFGITFALFRIEVIRDAPLLDYGLLLLSGVIGIAVADTLFFRSLNLVGAGLSQVASLSYSPFVILFTFVLLGERLTPGDFAGAALIMLGIFLTAGHRPPPGSTKHDLHKGIGFAILSMAMMALGVVAAKPVLDRSPLMWTTAVRLAGGTAALALLAAVSPRHRDIWRTLRPSRAWKISLPAAILGTYVAMLVWMAGMKHTQASTASILNQTSAVFVLPIAALVLKESITARKAVAVATAITGVALVTVF